MKNVLLLCLTSIFFAGCEQTSSAPRLLGDTEGVRWADGTPDFTAARSVLLIPLNRTETGVMKDFGTDDNCFFANARGLERFYVARGVAVTIAPINKPDVLMDLLDSTARKRKVFDRIVFLAHGGYHGPMFLYGKQIGLDWPEVTLKERESYQHSEYYRQLAFLDYGKRLNKVLSAGGWMWIGSCNSSTEGGSLFGSLRYTDAIACASDRMAYGVQGKTACWDVEDRVKKLEDGIKTPQLWRSNPKNLPAEMVCFGDPPPPMPPLLPPPDLAPPPPDAGPGDAGDGGDATAPGKGEPVEGGPLPADLGAPSPDAGRSPDALSPDLEPTAP